MTTRGGTPPLVSSLAAETREGADNKANLAKRLVRFSNARERSLEMRDYISRDIEQTPRSQKAAHELNHCGSYLLFRHYTELDRVRLAAMRSCRQHLICPFCAIRRGAKMMARYIERLNIVLEDHPKLRPWMVTFTVKNGVDLGERYQHLQRSVKRMGKERHYVRGFEIEKAAGAVWSYEFKRGAGSGQWHPHMHAVWLCTSPLDVAKLSAEWHRVTGDSFIIEAHEMYGDPLDAFAEVFKYAVKFADLPLSDNWSAAQTLRTKRLIRSSGLLWGVEVPDELTDELLDSPYVELFYRHYRHVGYVDADGVIARAA